jgi:hypothetical protein
VIANRNGNIDPLRVAYEILPAAIYGFAVAAKLRDLLIFQGLRYV